MGMTRKDYQLIADAITECTLLRLEDNTPVVKEGELINRLADALATTNPRFNRLKFVQAALIKGGGDV